MQIFCLNIFNFSEKLTKIFYEKNSLNFILNHILKSELFSLDNLFQGSNNHVRYHICCYLGDYLDLLSAIIRSNDSSNEKFFKKIEFRKYLNSVKMYVEYLQIEHSNYREELESHYFDLKFQCFICYLNFIDDDNDENLIIPQNFFDILQDKLDRNLCEKFGDDSFMTNEELLNTFIILSKSSKNSHLLQKILSPLSQFLIKNYNEKLQTLAATCIFSLINLPECKSCILNDTKLMKILTSPFYGNFKNIEFLRQNILYELNLRKDSKPPILFCYHSNNENIVNKILDFYTNTTNFHNILLLNSKCK